MDFTHFLQILVLAIVQGLAELLPVSSSAHVTIAARLMHCDLLDPKRVYEWTFLLIMLHTGTMFSVLIYFWQRWKLLKNQIPSLVLATVATAAVGLPLKYAIEKIISNSNPNLPPQDIESIFTNLPLIACSLAVVGLLIIAAGIRSKKLPGTQTKVKLDRALIIGATQGLALPFRGFSRSGSTISVGMVLNVARVTAEEFSFALAVILTPALIGYEVRKLLKEHGQQAVDAAAVPAANLSQLLLPGLMGMAFSFLAGLIALKWLSSWLEHGRWKFFGFYCLFAAAVVLGIHFLKI